MNKIQEQKKKLKGDKSVKPHHDSRKLASRYYAVSTGSISKAKKLKETKNTLLYNIDKAGQFTLDFLLSLSKIVKDDSQLLDFIDANNLTFNQARLIVKIQDEDKEFYEKILAEPEKIEDNLSIFYYKKDYSDLYKKLKAGTINIDYARAEKKKRKENTTTLEKGKDGTTDGHSDSPSIDIDNSLIVKIKALAQKNGKTVNEFLSQLIDKYAKENGKGKR